MALVQWCCGFVGFLWGVYVGKGGVSVAPPIVHAVIFRVRAVFVAGR